MPQQHRRIPCQSPDCRVTVRPASKSGYCQACFTRRRLETARANASTRLKTAREQPAALVETDRTIARLTTEAKALRAKYAHAVQALEQSDQRWAAMKEIRSAPVAPITITPSHGSGTSEGTVLVLASDWHVEERVDPATVSRLNDYSLEIATARATQFFRSALRLTRLLQQDIRIETLILALLGDFVTNQIHDDMAERNQLLPVDAIAFAQNLLVSGLRFLLEHSTLRVLVPCHSGNHARTTPTTRFASEAGHSLEHLMYLSLAAYFRSEPRITFQIADGYHSYMDVYGRTLRLHHGHAIRYQGGVGGLFIPTYKAIAQWNLGRRAHLDAFGHFHQTKDGGSFLTNGSLIGYNAFALSIKADFELPRQTLILLDKTRGRTCSWPILVT